MRDNPLKLTHAEASANILAFASEGRLTQRSWHGRSDEGREVACLLGSMHPSVKRASDCNGDLMPLWLAELTPTLFDGLPADQVQPIGLRYGALVARWHVLTPEQWDKIQTAFLVRVIDDAVSSARPVAEKLSCWEVVEKACAQVQRALNGDGSLKDAANAARYADAAAAYAADADADAARYAANAARYADAAARYATRNAANAAYSRLFTFLLDQIEQSLA